MLLSRLLLIGLLVAVPARLASQAIPPVAAEGLDFLVKGQADSAVGTWTQAWVAPEDAAKRQQLVESFRHLPQVVGAPLGYDLIRIVDLTPHLRRVYVLLRCQRQPVYLLIVLYSARDRWIVSSLNWHTDADHVLPPTPFGATSTRSSRWASPNRASGSIVKRSRRSRAVSASRPITRCCIAGAGTGICPRGNSIARWMTYNAAPNSTARSTASGITSASCGSCVETSAARWTRSPARSPCHRTRRSGQARRTGCGWRYHAQAATPKRRRCSIAIPTHRTPVTPMRSGSACIAAKFLPILCSRPPTPATSRWGR